MKSWKEQARSAGVPVFPIKIFWDDEAQKYQKKPLTRNGHKDASTDVDQFDWTGANGFGMPMGNGRYAIDADTYKEGHEVWDWFYKHNVPEETQVIRTVSGGEQFIFNLPKGYENLRTRNNVVLGLDTRGAGGWIAYGEGYRVTNEGPRATLPPNVCALLDAGPEPDKTFKTGLYDFGYAPPDAALRARVDALRAKNKSFDNAMGGGHKDRSAALASIAYFMKSEGFEPREYGAAVMHMSTSAQEHIHEQRGEPERALQRAWENNSATTPVSPERMRELAELVAKARGYDPEAEAEQVQPLNGYDLNDLAESGIKAPDPLIENLVSARLTYIVGDPKAGKSFATMQIAEAISSGTDLWDNRTTRAMRVLYFAPENGLEETVSRIRTMGLKGNIGFRFKDENMEKLPETIGELIELLSQECIDDPSVGCIVLDTLRWMSGPPVDIKGGNAQDKDFAKLEPLQSWSAATGVAVIAVAHTNKDPNGRDGLRSQLSSVAGSNLIAGTAESLLTVTRLLDPETKAPTPYGMIQRMGRAFREDGPVEVYFDRTTARFELITQRLRSLRDVIKTTRKNGSSRMDIVNILDEFPDGMLEKDVRKEVMLKRDVSRAALSQAVGDLLESGRVKRFDGPDGKPWLKLNR